MFEVQILYREPIYELWSGRITRQPYLARYHGIRAPDHGTAVLIAQARFRETARQSRVRWPREVLEVRVQPDQGPETVSSPPGGRSLR